MLPLLLILGAVLWWYRDSLPSIQEIVATTQEEIMPRILQIFGRDAFASPDTGEAYIHPELLAKLDALYDRVGGRLRVTGGYRTPAHNAQVGGAPNSFHLDGRAADMAPGAGLSWEELYEAAIAVGFTGVILEKTTGTAPHLHVDVGSRIYHAIT